ncbi:MAG: DUF1902 domain-containing protein [Oscillospiraceae bacterium]|nr:DUF1902 domain-containing protein [Oscillospiraceae bacterium]
MAAYQINFMWDDEAFVWIATSEDVPGLVLEHGSFDALVERIRVTVPELLVLNGVADDEISLSYSTQRYERLVVNG